jgi:hypothetical protein
MFHIQKIVDARDADGDERYTKVFYDKLFNYYKYRMYVFASPFASLASPLFWICDTAGFISSKVMILCD